MTERFVSRALFKENRKGFLNRQEGETLLERRGRIRNVTGELADSRLDITATARAKLEADFFSVKRVALEAGYPNFYHVAEAAISSQIGSLRSREARLERIVLRRK